MNRDNHFTEVVESVATLANQTYRCGHLIEIGIEDFALASKQTEIDKLTPLMIRLYELSRELREVAAELDEKCFCGSVLAEGGRTMNECPP